MSRSDLVDIDVSLHHETFPGSEDQGAYLVSLDDNRKKAVWVPKSAAEIARKTPKGRVWVLTLSETLATDKGLV